MYRIRIENIFGNSGTADFNGTLEQAMSEVESWVSNGAWGKPSRWLPDFLEGAETRQITTGNILTSEEGLEYNETITEYLHPAEYSYQIKDITAELEAARLKAEADALASKQAEIDKFNNQVKSLIKENEDLKAEIIRLEEAKIPRIEKLRNQRDALLAATDHTQLADFYNVLVAKNIDASKEITAYRAYRQYLRDVPNKYPTLEIIPSFSQWKIENNI